MVVCNRDTKNGHEREVWESNRHGLVQLARDDDWFGSIGKGNDIEHVRVTKRKMHT